MTFSQNYKKFYTPNSLTSYLNLFHYLYFYVCNVSTKSDNRFAYYTFSLSQLPNEILRICTFYNDILR